MKPDEEHLRLLSIFHYVVAGIAALCALVPIFHLIFGLIFILAPQKFTDHGQPSPAFIGWFFVIFAVLFIFLGWVYATLVFLTGHFLARRRHYTFCLVMAAVECLFMPFGTVLGIFTIVVLARESVKSLFAGQPPPMTGR